MDAPHEMDGYFAAWLGSFLFLSELDNLDLVLLDGLFCGVGHCEGNDQNSYQTPHKYIIV